MKTQDYGYNPKTMLHDKHLTRAEGVFVGILWVDYVGQENCIAGEDLAIMFAYGATGEAIMYEAGTIEIWMRNVREMQNHILHKHDHIPVLSMAGPGGGYFIGANDEEVEKFYYAFRKRGMTGLIKATSGKKKAMVEAVEQLAFEFDDLVDKTMPAARGLTTAKGPIAGEIVDQLLAKMSLEPEKFADNLRKIREKYFSGGVLLDRTRIAAMKAKTRELQMIVADLEH